MDEELLIAMLPALRPAVGLALGKYRSKIFWEWRRINHYPKICAICHQVAHKATIDHIIPVSVCLELGLEGLVFDFRNLQLACRECNIKKEASLESLPIPVQKKIAQLRKTCQPA